MVSTPIIKSKLISIKVPDNVTAQTVIRFPQDNEIDGRVCLGFSCYNRAIISVCPDGRQAVNDLFPVAVTLRNPKSTKYVDNYPAFAADPINVFGLFVAVQPFIISMQESTLQYFQAAATFQESFPINVYYCEVADFKRLSETFKNNINFMLR